DGIGVDGVKFAVYLEPLTGATGALRFPWSVAETRPGDVVAFGLHTWHASSGGSNRLAWTVEYLRTPGDEAERARVLDAYFDNNDQTYGRFDHERYPVWRDWARNPAASLRRAQVIERMRSIGVFDLPGAGLGDVRYPRS